MSIGAVIAAFFLLMKNESSPTESKTYHPQLESSLNVQEPSRDPQTAGLTNAGGDIRDFKPKIGGSEALKISRQFAMARKAAHRQERAISHHRLFEVPNLAAHKNKKGYSFVPHTRAESALEWFNGTDLPVVRRPNSHTLGVATGDIVVTFKQLPENSENFAENFELKTVKEFRKINVIFFRPRHLPANLSAHLEELRTSPDVKKAELSVVFGERRTQ